MPVLKVKKNGVWEELGGTSPMNGGNADTLGGQPASSFVTKEAFNSSMNTVLNELSVCTNQNAFSNVKVGTTTIAADSATDTLTLVAGNNITLTPNSTSDQITISATNDTYTHPNSGVTAGTYKSVTVNSQGHVTSGTNPTTLNGYGITDGASKTYVTTQINNALANFSSGKTLAEHLTEEDLILVEGKHYGNTLPVAGNKGRIFFLRTVE